LEKMDAEMVFGILSRVPKAREDLINCQSICYIDEDYVTFANQKGTLVREPGEILEENMRRVNRHVDNHRLQESNSTLPKPPDTSDEED
jgi:hypothetical protein